MFLIVVDHYKVELSLLSNSMLCDKSSHQFNLSLVYIHIIIIYSYLHNIFTSIIYLDVSSDKPAPQKVPRIRVETFLSLRVLIIAGYLLSY